METDAIPRKRKWSKRRILLYMIAIYLLLNALLSLGGCGRLHSDWKAVFARNADSPRIIGIIPDNEPNESSRTLVLEYSVFPYNHSWGPDFSKLQVAITLMNGKPINPLKYEGPISREAMISNMEPQEQAQAVASYRFSPESINQVRKHMEQNKMIPINKPESCFARFGIQESVMLVDDPEIVWGEIIPYWFSNPILDASKAIAGSDDDLYNYRYYDLYSDPPALAPPDGILIVPSKQPRPWSDRRQALVWAIMKTPVDLCVDAVMTPIHFVYFSFFRLTGNIWW